MLLLRSQQSGSVARLKGMFFFNRVDEFSRLRGPREDGARELLRMANQKIKVIMSTTSTQRTNIYNQPSVPNDACTVIAHRFNHPSGSVSGFGDMEGGEGHGDGHEYRRIGELFAWADAPPETECQVVWV